MKIITLILCVFCFYSCTDDQLQRGRDAEMYYADLYVAIHSDNIDEAQQAANELEKVIVSVRKTWVKPSKEDEMDDVYFRIERAQETFEEVQVALGAGELSLAALQLDRATYELSAADLESFRVLYLGSIYSFLSSWYSYYEIIEAVDFCGYEQAELERYSTFILKEWVACKAKEPSELIYFLNKSTKGSLGYAQNRIELQLHLLENVLVVKEDSVIREEARQANKLIMELVALFGTEPILIH